MFVGKSLSSKVAVAGGLVLVFLLGSLVGRSPSPTTAADPSAIVPTGSSSSGITVTGTATLAIAPDLARIVVSVETTASTAAQAESKNATVAAQVRTRAQAAGVRADDIKTVGFQIWPQYDYRSGNQPPTLTGFMANHTLEITVRDTGRIGQVIDAAVAGGATSVQGVSYDSSNRTASETAALTQAVKDATAKASAMAAAAGVRLGAVLSLTDNQQYTPYPFPIMRGAAAPASADTQVAPPNVELTVSVTVNWAIAR
jgi:uncharacterized protein